MGQHGHRDRTARAAVLIVEDDRDTATELSRFLEEEYDCLWAKSAAAAQRLAREREFCLALIDLDLGEGPGGFEVIRELRKIDPRVAVVIVSGDDTESAIRSAARLDVQDFIPKSVGRDELRRSLRRSLLLRRIHERVQRLESEQAESEPPMVAESPRMRQVEVEVVRAARHTAPVLITGPVGAGKMVVARRIHLLSRPNRPFERMHCATLDTGELADSQLFGYEPGAHSTAHNRFIGAMERAGDGTLLLDDIDYLPLRVQGKLLQPLQERVMRRLPGSVEVKVKCRIIATTNKDLAAMTERGAFQADLYSRLWSGHVIEVPPLSERIQDIPGLVQTTVMQVAAESGRKVSEVPAGFVEAVASRRWRSARELHNAIRSAVGISDGGPLTEDCLPAQAGRAFGPAQAAPSGIPGRSDLLDGPLDDVLDCVRTQAVLQALEACGQDKPRAALRLGITVQWLNAILRKGPDGPARRKDRVARWTEGSE